MDWHSLIISTETHLLYVTMKATQFLFCTLLFSLTSFIVRAQIPTIVYEESISIKVQPHYKHRSDGQAGREILIRYNGKESLSKANVEIVTKKEKELTPWQISKGDSASILLPPTVGLHNNDTVLVRLIIDKKRQIEKLLPVEKLRQWTVYIYPHSHVDIGYTNTQANVEIIHKRNIDYAIELAEQTKNYPSDARFRWNTEVTWPVERYMASESPERREALINAIKAGVINVEAAYVHTNTSAAAGEELFELFSYSKKLEKMTGKPIETLTQVDIPGMSWGVVPVAAQMGIRYILAMNNGNDRIGNSLDVSFKPFWWVDPDGKSKILFIEPFSYVPGAKAKGKYFYPSMLGQMNPDSILKIVKTDNPRKNFIDDYLWPRLEELGKANYYPYDIFPMTWSMADNTPVDADLPDAVKSWNEEYAFPHLKICTSTEILKAFEEKYGNGLPTWSGDFTEYWTDGLGSAAKYTGRNREVKEELIQTETLWSMLCMGQKPPKEQMDEAWRNVILGTEHTWAYTNPNKQPIQDIILGTKFSYFTKADSISQSIRKEIVSSVETEGEWYAVFNTHSWNQSGMVKIHAERSKGYNGVCDESGKKILSQRISTGELLFWAEDVPPLGMKKYRLTNGKDEKKGTLVINNNSLDNGITHVTIDPHSGDIISLIHKGEEFVDKKSTAALNSYRYLHGGDESGKATGTWNNRIEIKENGPLVGTIRIISEAEGCNRLVREVSLTAGTSQVSIYNEVDKLAIKEKEGIHFGFAFDVSNPVTKVDIPWGIMELEKDQLPAGNRNWIALQRWLDISNDEKGVTWSAPNALTFESGDITANILGGSFQSPKWIKKLQPSATLFSWALNNHWYTNFPLTQEGVIKYEYHILPRKGVYNAALINQFGVEQVQPLVAIPVAKDFEYHTNLKLEGSPAIVLSQMKGMENGKETIVRLRSVSSKDEQIQLKWQTKQPKSVQVYEYHGNNKEENLLGKTIKVPSMGLTSLKVVW